MLLSEEGPLGPAPTWTGTLTTLQSGVLRTWIEITNSKLDSRHLDINLISETHTREVVLRHNKRVTVQSKSRLISLTTTDF